MEDKDNSIPSPISVPFDYNKYREDKTNPVIKKILRIVADNADKLTFSGKFTLEEFNERFDEVSKEVIASIVEGGVAESDRGYIFEYLTVIFKTIDDNISKQVSGHKREILSRVIGTRNPGSDKFDVDYCNFGDILSTLLKVREQTGGNNEDYFFINKNK